MPDDCQAAAQQLSSLSAIADNSTVLDGKSCVLKKQNGCLAFACNTADKKITTGQAISGSSVQDEQQSVLDTCVKAKGQNGFSSNGQRAIGIMAVDPNLDIGDAKAASQSVLASIGDSAPYGCYAGWVDNGVPSLVDCLD